MFSYQNKARSLLPVTNFTWSPTLANLTEYWTKKCDYGVSAVSYGGFQHGSNSAAWTGITPTGKDCAQKFSGSMVIVVVIIITTYMVILFLCFIVIKRVL